MMEEKLPGLLYPDASATDTVVSEQTVFAIQYNDDDPPEAANLPPEVANIFFRPISLNRASKNILSTLPGIGPVLAEKIVQWRKENGPFRSLDELLQITGIGPGKLAHLVEHIFID
jgi:competence protein ComEA